MICPQCGIENQFWGIKDEEGNVIEHFGRQCQAALENPITLEAEKCGYRFRFKRCDSCGEENDIAARVCSSCKHLLVDNDKKLKEAMSLKDAHVMRVELMQFHAGVDKKGNSRLEVNYFDADAEVLKEYFYLNSSEDCRAFYFNFIRMHNRLPEKPIQVNSLEDAIKSLPLFRSPMFVISRKMKNFWAVREKIFN